MPSQYSSDIKARALALLTAGEPASHVAATLRAEDPASTLSERTVQFWASRFRQIALNEDDKTLIDEDYRIALRYSELLHLAADYIGEDDTGERAAKALYGINAARGTSVDKILKRQELAQRAAQPEQDNARPLIVFIQGNIAPAPAPTLRITETTDIVIEAMPDDPNG